MVLNYSVGETTFGGKMLKYLIVRDCHKKLQCKQCGHVTGHAVHLRYRYCPKCQEFLDKIRPIKRKRKNERNRSALDKAYGAVEELRYEDAIQSFTSFIANNDFEDSASHMARGLAYHDNGDFDLAIADYTRCIDAALRERQSSDEDDQTIGEFNYPHAHFERSRAYPANSYHLNRN